MTADDVAITWKTPAVTAATVRDSTGIYDVRQTSSSGWTCTCPDQYGCAHVAAVRQLTEAND